MSTQNRRRFDADRIRLLRQRQWSWHMIAEYSGASIDTVRCCVDPVYKARAQAKRRDYEAKRGNRHRLDHGPHDMGGERPSALFRVPEAVIAERERVAAITPTPNQAILGDPLPGRSALDRRRPHGVVDHGC